MAMSISRWKMASTAMARKSLLLAPAVRPLQRRPTACALAVRIRRKTWRNQASDGCESCLQQAFARHGRVFAIGLFFLFIFQTGILWAQLDLEATVVTGETAIDFGNVRSLDSRGEPLSDTSVRQVRLVITSDLQRPYVISQILQDSPLNSNGTAIEPEALRFRVIVENGSGIVRTSDLEPLRPGMQEIYLSSDNEAQTVLLITYNLTPAPGQKAGRYQGTISYRADAR